MWSQALTPTGQLTTAPPAPVGISDGMGGSYVSGALTATLDLGCGPMVPSATSIGYVAHLGSTSNCIYSRALPAVPAVLGDTSGAVLSVSSTTALDLGCGSLAAASGGSTFVTRLDPAGNCVFGTSLAALGLAVLLDPSGSAVVSGLAGAAAVDFGGGPLAPLGSNDIVLGEIDVSGNYLWGDRFGGAGITFAGPWVTLSQAGNVYLRTGWGGSVDLGGGAITAVAGGVGATGDTVVASYTPSGAVRWSRDFAILGGYIAGIDGCGSLVLMSTPYQQFDPGLGILPPSGQISEVAAVVRYAP